MLRTATVLSLCALLGATSTGCTNLVASRAIETFAGNLAEADVDGLKASTSSDFREKALRGKTVANDLKMLDIPTGNVTVVEVEDISPREQKVMVHTGPTGSSPGKGGEMTEYRLVREGRGGKWVVHDVILTQQRGKKKPVSQSASEQMDLLLSVREFLSAWQTGSPEQMLAETTPEFSEVLAALPPTSLLHLTRKVLGGDAKGVRFKPKAEFKEDRAIVTLPRGTGDVVIEMTQINGQWRVNELAVDSKRSEDRIGSVRQHARLLTQVAEFLKAYEVADKSALETLSTTTLYNGSLSVGDLSQVPIPATVLMTADFDLRTPGERAEITIDALNETYLISLLAPPEGATSDSASYRVEDITIFEHDSGQVKRLSTMFTSHAVLELFAQAVSQRDLDGLKYYSSSDLRERVWDLADAASVAALPLDELAQAAPEVTETVFRGDVTEVTVTQGEFVLTYVLTVAQGRQLVDDIILPVENRPTSLKQSLEVLVPLYSFTVGMHADDIARLKQHSSADLTRLLWRNVQAVPDIGFDVPQHLLASLDSMQRTESEALVKLGTEEFGARVLMVRQHNKFVVDDVEVYAGIAETQRAELKQTMRQQVISRGYGVQSIQPASHQYSE